MKHSAFVWFTLLLLASLELRADATSLRVVSLNPCLDAIIVELIDAERIAAISHYSRDPWRSTITEIAARLPVNYQTAEEVVALRPDLVLASRHSAVATHHALARVGIRVELFDVPYSIAGSVRQIREIAALLHSEKRGEILIRRIESALAAARPAPDQLHVTAVIYQPDGLTAGAATVTGELMRAAGLDNVAARYGVEQWHPLPLELLVSAPPELLLVGLTMAGAPTHAEKLLHHRALRALGDRMERAVFPVRLLYCAGPAMIDALEVLVAARDQVAR